ncbi:hypothetical protein AAE478_010107 [Parahypoxylon ruwenzoriense]
MPSFAKLMIPVSYLLGLALSLPAGSSAAAAVTTRHLLPRQNGTSCPAGSSARVFARELYTLWPNEPDAAYPATADLHVQYHNDTQIRIMQAAVFGPFPPQAQGCAFGWAQDDARRGVLVAGGSGLLTIRQLAGFPASGQPVSWANVAPFNTSTHAAHPDFTAWDRELHGTTHSSGPGSVECGGSEYVYVLIEKEGPTTGNVFLKKTEDAGVFVDYRCPEADP